MIFSEIDKIIQNVDQFRYEPIFADERNKRQNKTFSPFLNDDEILKKLSHLIAYSQNANSEMVEQVLKSGNFGAAFLNFKIDEVAKLNPCDIAEEHWNSKESGNRQNYFIL